MNAIETLHGSRVRELLAKILSGSELPIVRQYLGQVRDVTIAGGTLRDLELEVPVPSRIKDEGAGALPAYGVVQSASGEVIGVMNVLVANGALQSLESTWYDDVEPTSLPAAEMVAVRHVDS